jgi:hypothetical protein
VKLAAIATLLSRLSVMIEVRPNKWDSRATVSTTTRVLWPSCYNFFRLAWCLVQGRLATASEGSASVEKISELFMHMHVKHMHVEAVCERRLFEPTFPCAGL